MCVLVFVCVFIYEWSNGHEFKPFRSLPTFVARASRRDWLRVRAREREERGVCVCEREREGEREKREGCVCARERERERERRGTRVCERVGEKNAGLFWALVGKEGGGRGRKCSHWDSKENEKKTGDRRERERERRRKEYV